MVDDGMGGRFEGPEEFDIGEEDAPLPPPAAEETGEPADAPPPASEPAPTAAEMDPDSPLARLAEAKGWTTPEQIAQGYIELEKQFGDRGRVEGHEQKAAQQQSEQEQLVEMFAQAMARNQQPQQPQAPSEPEIEVPTFDWEAIARANGADDETAATMADAFEHVLPQVMAPYVERAVAPLVKRLEDQQQFIDAQNMHAQVVNTVQQMQQENPAAWGIAGDLALTKLDAMIEAGRIPTPQDARMAFGEATLEAIAAAAAAEANNPTPPAPPATSPPAAAPQVTPEMAAQAMSDIQKMQQQGQQVVSSQELEAQHGAPAPTTDNRADAEAKALHDMGFDDTRPDDGL